MSKADCLLVIDGVTVLIDGAPVTEQVLAGRKSTPCEQCEFNDWKPGDTCYIVEQWQNEDSAHGAREHLCPTCAVLRGLPVDKFRQNEEAPKVDVKLLAERSCIEQQINKQVDGKRCRYCRATSVSTSDFVATGLVAITFTNVYMPEAVYVCLKCCLKEFPTDPNKYESTKLKSVFVEEETAHPALSLRLGPERDVSFISERLGIRLNCGADGIVRVIWVLEDKSRGEDGHTLPSKLIHRMGNLESGDVVREAAGVDLRKPITKAMWGDTLKLLKVAPRPLKFVVSKELSEKPVGFHEEFSKAKRQLEPSHGNDNVTKKEVENDHDLNDESFSPNKRLKIY